jgi:WD40 repeat protein
VPLALSNGRNGDLLTTTDGRSLNRWDLAAQARSKGVDLVPGVGSVDRSALSPDGKWLLLSDASGDVNIYSAASGQVVQIPDEKGAALHEMAFSPNGDWLATSHNDFTIRLRRTSDWRTVHRIKHHKMRTAGLEFSPDSQILASASWDGTAALFDVGTGNLRAAFRGHTTSLQDLAFLSGGNLIALLEGDASISFWDLRSNRGSARLPASLSESNYYLTAAPDESFLFSTKLSGGRPGIWRAKNSR